ncbi:MAG: DUF5009 domain-containing protein [Paramuribaculum sp.]|nr:DUF5009 domain-containing protein [Bacteroides sp.]MBD5375067.1 DUF5009 domain-containing protein [Bacteroides sp.]MBD5375520.1 DUF5009 domain-containing protein [Bacteroides sp.]MDE7459844.1 DUF5009 domain-containing protein [Paramuribaculum sp.]
MAAKTVKSSRLESLDILRGFDLFCLVGLEAVVHALSHAAGNSWLGGIARAFTHADWVGFTPWDLVMPLFMFMAGVTIPFTRTAASGGNTRIWLRVLKRVVLLWLFGMMCQGNLLALDPDRVYVYTNTLQAIAAGYLIAVALYLTSSLEFQAVCALLFLALYWAGMEFITIDGFGGGDYTPQANFAEWVDRVCLGRYRDGAVAGAGGTVVFARGYHYTWIWSTLTFAVTVMLGVFAGALLRNGKVGEIRKTVLLALGGVVLVGVGLMLGHWHPIIKRIWTASMTLFSGGLCWLLMALFYYVIDCLGVHRGLRWLKVYGMNSIVAYMLMSCVNFRCVAESFLYGLAKYMGAWYEVVVAAFCSVIIYLILLLLYRNKIFLKV